MQARLNVSFQDKPVKINQNLRAKKNVALSKVSNEYVRGQFDSAERLELPLRLSSCCFTPVADLNECALARQWRTRARRQREAGESKSSGAEFFSPPPVAARTSNSLRATAAIVGQHVSSWNNDWEAVLGVRLARRRRWRYGEVMLRWLARVGALGSPECVQSVSESWKAVGKNGDATASGLNFVPRRFAVWARPVGESVSFEALSQACLERSASACLFRRQSHLLIALAWNTLYTNTYLWRINWCPRFEVGVNRGKKCSELIFLVEYDRKCRINARRVRCVWKYLKCISHLVWFSAGGVSGQRNDLMRPSPPLSRVNIQHRCKFTLRLSLTCALLGPSLSSKWEWHDALALCWSRVTCLLGHTHTGSFHTTAGGDRALYTDQ